MIKNIDTKVKKQLALFLFSFTVIYFAALYIFLTISQHSTIEEIKFKIGNIKAEFFENEVDFKKAIYQAVNDKEFTLAREKVNCEDSYQIIEGYSCFNYLPVPKKIFLKPYLKVFNYGAVFFIFLVSVIFINLVFSFKRIVSPLIENIRTSERDLVYAEVAKQVNHDLKSVLQSLRDVSDEVKSRELEIVSERIIEITNDLKNHAKEISREDVMGHQKFNIARAVKEILDEKKTLNNSKMINFEFIEGEASLSKFSNIDRGKFRRMLSNVLNNAIDAIKDSGKIKVKIGYESGFFKIEVVDDGAGISIEVLEQIGQKGFTTGKVSGEGRGIFSAKKFLEEINGSFEINSHGVGQGAVVIISIPISDLGAIPSKEVVLIDDHKSTYHNWEFMRQKKGIDIKIHYFDSVDEFLKIHQNFKKEVFIYVDSQLKDGKQGEVESEKIANLGFQTIIIQSSEPDNVPMKLWITGISTKEFPF